MARQKQPPKERTPEEQKAHDRKQMIIMLVIMGVIIVGTGVHYYVYSQRQKEAGREVGPSKDGPRTLIETLTGDRPGEPSDADGEGEAAEGSDAESKTTETTDTGEESNASDATAEPAPQDGESGLN
jgi:flagellar basal body-associated protein FliL